jgi:hypothetical protein
MSLDTYKLPLYFAAKVKVKEEVICKAEPVHHYALIGFYFSGKCTPFLLISNKKD